MAENADNKNAGNKNSDKKNADNKKADNMLDNWQEMQKKFMDMWKDTVMQAGPVPAMNFDGEKNKEIMDNWWKMQQQMQQNMMNMMGGMMEGKMEGKEGNIDFSKLCGAGFKWSENMPDFLNPMSAVNAMNAMNAMNPMNAMKAMGPMGGSVEKMNKFYQEWLKNSFQDMEEFMQWAPKGVGKEAFSKMKQAGDIYISLLTYWMDNMVQFPDKDDVEKWREFSQNWGKNYNNVLEKFFMMNLPDSIKDLVKSPAETGELFRQILFNFLQPWFEMSPELKDKFVSSLRGDREAYKDLLHGVHSIYQESYGRVFRVPAFGISRENMERVAESIDTYMHFTAAINEFMAVLMKNGYDVMEELTRKTVSLAEKGIAPSTFKEFYDLWWHTNEDAYFEVFRTESFGKILGEVVNEGAKFKESYDKLMTNLITEKLPIPTKNDMDSVYKTIYVLKKKVNAQERKISAMEEADSSSADLAGMEKKLTDLDKNYLAEMEKKDKEIYELKKLISKLTDNMDKMGERLNQLEAVSKTDDKAANKAGSKADDKAGSKDGSKTDDKADSKADDKAGSKAGSKADSKAESSKGGA